MAYVKNIWVDQDVERPKTYEVTNNQDGSITLTDSFGLVTELGTPVNEVNMNHIEDGIDGCAIRKHNLTETFNLGEWVLGGTGDDEGIYKSLIANNVGNAITDNTKWEKVEMGGGGGYEIGDIIFRSTPTNDAGKHLLDGALIQYGSYRAFVDYIADLYNTTKQYNPNAFTVVGAPTITSDGIASGFSDSKYLKTESMSFGSSVWEITGKFTFASSSYNQSLFSGITNASAPLLYITGSTGMQFNIPSSVGTWGWQLTNASHTFTVGNTYYYKAGWDGTNYYIKVSDDLGSTWITLQTMAGTAMLGGSGSFALAIGSNPAQSNRYITGSIDLKEYQISVGGVTTFSGAKTDWSCLESDWQAAVLANGVCDKFVYNSTNNTVRLPKYGSQIWSGGGNAPVVGNGMSLGLTNGSSEGSFGTKDGMGNDDPRYYQTVFREGLQNKTVGTDNGLGFTSWFSTATGVSQNAANSGLIAQLSDITTSLDVYYYIVIATTTKTSRQVDIDEIATDLNGKADVDLSNVPNSKGILTESYRNGTSWYRVYSDGWCEQGGVHNLTGSTSYIILLINYVDINYNCIASWRYDCGSNSNNMGILPYSTSQIVVYDDNYGTGKYITWQASGYIR